MSNSVRSLEQVQQEHNNTAFRVGVVNYQIRCLKDELSVLYPKMLVLNEEGAAIMKAQKESNNAEVTPQPTVAPAI